MERAILVLVSFGPLDRGKTARRLAELTELARTAGAEVVETFSQDRTKPDPRLFIGSGLAEKIGSAVHEFPANLVIIWNDISPGQERNLQSVLGIKVINRTELILDIFAQHARTREGALQVEMAQATYLLTRLTGRGIQMSRLGGGIGTRGPGETKLEMDRRRLRYRIAELRRELERLVREREVQRDLRKRAALPLVAIVGYTNAGKSTLLRALTGANVLVQDKLFSTLDPTVRRLRLPQGGQVLLIDTVGFVENLPQALISAFQATLEEVRSADLLLHVADLSDQPVDDKILTVAKLLKDIGASGKPVITIFNKADLIAKKPSQRWLRRYRPCMVASLSHDQGVREILASVSQWAMRRLKKIRLKIPFSESRLLSEIYQLGQVVRQTTQGDMLILEARVPPEMMGRLGHFVISRR